METKIKKTTDQVHTAKYRQGQLSRLINRTGEFLPKVRFFHVDGLSTNYMNITADELAAIEKLLTKAAQPPKVNILSTADAMQNCVKIERSDVNGADWYTIYRDRIESALLEALPHGSGIDCKWKFDYTDKAIFCRNDFHHMNAAGYYTGWIDFQVKIYIDHRTIDGKIDFTISGRFGKNYQEIKNHLYEIIEQNLDSL